MKTTAYIGGLAAIIAAVHCQLYYNDDGGYYCGEPNVAYCASDVVLVQCDDEANGIQEDCSAALADDPPAGALTGQCHQSNPSAGDAVCTKNGVVYSVEPSASLTANPFDSGFSICFEGTTSFNPFGPTNTPSTVTYLLHPTQSGACAGLIPLTGGGATTLETPTTPATTTPSVAGSCVGECTATGGTLTVEPTQTAANSSVPTSGAAAHRVTYGCAALAFAAIWCV